MVPVLIVDDGTFGPNDDLSKEGLALGLANQASIQGFAWLYGPVFLLTNGTENDRERDAMQTLRGLKREERFPFRKTEAESLPFQSVRRFFESNELSCHGLVNFVLVRQSAPPSPPRHSGPG